MREAELWAYMLSADITPEAVFKSMIEGYANGAMHGLMIVFWYHVLVWVAL